MPKLQKCFPNCCMNSTDKIEVILSDLKIYHTTVIQISPCNLIWSVYTLRSFFFLNWEPIFYLQPMGPSYLHVEVFKTWSLLSGAFRNAGFVGLQSFVNEAANAYYSEQFLFAEHSGNWESGVLFFISGFPSIFIQNLVSSLFSHEDVQEELLKLWM